MENVGKLSAINITFHYHFFAAGAPCILIGHIFLICWNRFLQLKEQVPFKFEKNISGSMLNEDLRIDTTIDPC